MRVHINDNKMTSFPVSWKQYMLPFRLLLLSALLCSITADSTKWAQFLLQDPKNTTLQSLLGLSRFRERKVDSRTMRLLESCEASDWVCITTMGAVWNMMARRLSLLDHHGF